MDEAVITNRLPNFLTTVTPLSKFLAFTLFVTFPFVGFYLGFKYHQLATPLPLTAVSAIPKPSPPPDTTPQTCTQKLCVKAGVVYYTTDQGQKIEIKMPESENNLYRPGAYTYAQLSPGKKFILIETEEGESFWNEVYDVAAGKTYSIDAGGEGVWLGDGKILIKGGCGLGFVNCGEILISKNNIQPWILEKYLNYYFNPDAEAQVID